MIFKDVLTTYLGLEGGSLSSEDEKRVLQVGRVRTETAKIKENSRTLSTIYFGFQGLKSEIILLLSIKF